MKKFRLSAFVALAVACCLWCLTPISAYADSVTLTFTGVGGTTANSGIDYAYPYYFTVERGGQAITNVPLMCISFLNTITVGESWKADIVPANTSPELKEAAWLLSDAIANPQNTTMDQDAAWYVFALAPGTGNNSQYIAAQNFVSSNPGSDLFDDFQIYIPVPGSESWGLLPQTFIGVTPEPSNILLLGSGLALLAFVLFRERLAA